MQAAPLASILSHMRTGPSRTWSLIVTIFGDLVVPRGGRLWLGTLLEICAALDIGGNVVRTAVSRLVADGWLERHRLGRHSFYRLAGPGRAAFAAAAARVYGGERPPWTGSFSLALLPPEAAPAAAALGRAGYEAIAPTVLVGLRAAEPFPADAIRLDLRADLDGARRAAALFWPEGRLAGGYRRLLAALAPLHDQVRNGPTLSDEQALIGRLLLVHEYRRLVLRDPLLPEALLPPDDPALAARALCADLYPKLLPGSERWLDRRARNEAGPLPPPDASLRARFPL